MNESHNTRLGGMRQDILDFKNEFTSSIESLKSSINEKFNFEVKDSIIKALKAENLQLQQKVEKLENRISGLESDPNKVKKISIIEGKTLIFREYHQILMMIP